jgi:hypothetical protein
VPDFPAPVVACSVPDCTASRGSCSLPDVLH